MQNNFNNNPLGQNNLPPVNQMGGTGYQPPPQNFVPNYPQNPPQNTGYTGGYYNPPPPIFIPQQNPQNYGVYGNPPPYYGQGYPPQNAPVYYGYPPTYPPPVQVVMPPPLTPEQIALKNEKKVFKSTANRIGLGLILFYIFTFAFSFLLGLVGSFKSEILTFIAEPSVNLMLNILLTFFGFVGVALFIFKTEGEKPHNLLSYGLPQRGKFWAAVMLGLGFCYTANVAVTMLQTRLEGILPFAQTDIQMPDGILGFLLAVLSVAVAPALFEEFLFRGAIMGSLLKYGKGFAIFTSAIVFGLVHGNLVQIPFAFMVGLVLGFVALETNSIWTAVIIHFLNNLLSVCLDYCGRLVTEEIINGAYIILLGLIIMVGFVGFYLLSRKNNNLFALDKSMHLSTAKQRFGWFSSSAAIIIFYVIVGLEVLSTQLMAGVQV